MEIKLSPTKNGKGWKAEIRARVVISNKNFNELVEGKKPYAFLREFKEKAVQTA